MLLQNKYHYHSLSLSLRRGRCLLLLFLLLLFGACFAVTPFPALDLACAPSTETFKSRLIEAIRTVVAPSRTVTTIHAGVGARGQPLQAF